MLRTFLATLNETRWKIGKGHRCNYVDPAGRRCELDHLHIQDYCLTTGKRGMRRRWKGLNWAWDEEEKDFLLRPVSWRWGEGEER